MGLANPFFMCYGSGRNPEVIMHLQSVGLRGRRFVIQFAETMAEFGGVIPWLDGLNELRFATNGAWFADELQRRLGQRDSIITPYQFTDAKEGRTYIGGILHFSRSPEVFRDARNAQIAEQLNAEGASFISCLHMRQSLRAAGIGGVMMPRAIAAIRLQHAMFWGVVSDRRILPWYASLGALTPSPIENRDQLWIVLWPALT